MAVRVRSTEQLEHPVWRRMKSVLKIGELQGLVFKATDEQLVRAIRHPKETIELICLEAAEYDRRSEFLLPNIFPEKEWLKKIAVARFLNAPLFLLTYGKNDRFLFRLHRVTLDRSFKPAAEEIDRFADEKSFVIWWASIKRLNQTKRTVEAKPRQHRTRFDRVIERHGFQWGGNIDGFWMANRPPYVRAIFEVRQTHRYPLDEYDPARFFSGTAKKGGDYKTWLPLVYLHRRYDLPLVLITLNSREPDLFGFAEVQAVSERELIYADQMPPGRNVTADIGLFKKWLERRVNRAKPNFLP